jgi:AcrR family transcriptional regulator
MFSDTPDSSPRRDSARARIRAAALASFRERGYDATTIRRIAEETGVSVGTTNYHFASKNHLVQELYLEVQTSHRDAAAPALAAAGADLAERVGIVYRTGLDQLTPYHPHAPEFLSAAVSPRSEINPLSAASAPALAIVEELFATAVDGAAGVPADLRAGLPRALVLAHLLLALYWVYDRSPGQRRTRALLEGGVRILKTVQPMLRLPLVRRPVRDLLDLVADAGE